MRIRTDWWLILTRAYSVRFNLFNALCQGILWGTGALGLGFEPPVVAVFVVGCVLLNTAPILARIMWQPDFHTPDDD